MNVSSSERNERLLLDRIRHSLLRSKNSQESREQRLENDRIQHAVSRSLESDDSREQRLEDDRIRHAVSRTLELSDSREKILESDRCNPPKQREFESQEQHVTRVTEQCDRYHESQGQRIELLAQLRESVSAIRQAETNFDRERRLFTSRQTTSALRDIEKKIELREDLKSRRGLAVSLEIICHNCGESTSTMSSKISNKCYDVNLRLTDGVRAIGKGGAAARIFCGLMNLLHHLQTVHEAVIANDNNSNIAVAVDGTWHKRGYSSLNGVVCATSVENGKVIDFEALTKYCSSCKEVEKLECVGHVQKRMGTWLRNILKMSKGIKLSDGKNISGRGRLTLKEVDSIQHYYGLVIRKNLSSVEDMKRAIWAIYFHKLSTEDNPQHALCPLEKDLLKKCFHGRTQNPNESFNKCIWERIPKTVFVGIETLKFGVMDAVICFNDGYVSRIKVFEALGIKPGYNTERALLIIDNKRIFEAERIVNKVSLEARNKRRSLKRKMDKQNLDEENEYQAGKY
ncbi:uncharacterized protein TNCV_3154161 [Trichonephila clavipes]|nr:uncharacterized protein TNCV_3154161 [Trichonephila clavipes]